MASWDLWIDYHRRDADRLTHGNVRNARAEFELAAGRYVVVGNENADAAAGAVDDNSALLATVPTT